MKVILPSCGALGLKTVELRPITLSDIRSLHNSSQDPNMAKVELVQSLCDVDLSHITKWDLDFLYNLSMFSVVYNTVEFTSECPHCHNTFKNSFSIDGVEVKTLRKYKPLTKQIGKESYTFHVVSAQQFVDALTYAVPEEDEQAAYEDSIVAFTLGKELTSSDLEWVRKLPAKVYMLCFYFQQSCFHGVALTRQSECPHCHKSFTTFLNVPTDAIKVPLAKLMGMYTSVADQVTYEDFGKMTIPEYDYFIKALNERSKILA